LNFGHFSLLEVIAAKEEILPRRWGIYHRQRSLQLQIHIVDLVKLPDERLNETLVESNVANVIFKFSFRAAGSVSLHQRLEQQEVLVANLVLEIFAHEVGQERSHFELHVSIHRPDRVVIDEQVLFHRIFLL